MDKKFIGFSLIAQEKLQAIICSIPGKKNLIIENALIKPLEHVCSASWLRLKGIQRIFKFDEQGPMPCGDDEVLVFMISSRVHTFNMVLKFIQTDHSREELPYSADHKLHVKKFHIICVPNCFAQFTVLLEAKGLYGVVQLHRFNWDFIVVDKDVLSMELPHVFPTVFLSGDTSFLPAIGQSIRLMHGCIFGQPDLIVSYGQQSSNIVRILKNLGSLQNEVQPPKLNVMILMDREKDYVSGLLTPSIYAGLLLEVFHLHAGELNIDDDSNKIIQQKLKLFQLPSDESGGNKNFKSSKIKLNCDEIFAENRFKHFSKVSALIHAQAKSIGIEAQKLNEMKLEEMHEYVARKLPKVTELKGKILRHLNASEKIIEMLAENFLRIRSLEEDILNNQSRKRALEEINELLSTDGQKYNTLRLFCLLHLSAGIEDEELGAFVQNFCNYFGAKCLNAFQNLARAGLLPELQLGKSKKISASKLFSNLPIPKFQQTEFQANCNRLRLLVKSPASDTSSESSNAGVAPSSDNTSSENISPSFVFNGLYIPLIAQICALIVKFSSAEDFATKFGMIDLDLHVPGQAETFTPKSYANSVRQKIVKELFPLPGAEFLVFVVGGITYAEIAACKLIERTTGVKISLASDSIISGSDLIQSAF